MDTKNQKVKRAERSCPATLTHTSPTDARTRWRYFTSILFSFVCSFTLKLNIHSIERKASATRTHLSHALHSDDVTAELGEPLRAPRLVLIAKQEDISRRARRR